MAMDHNLRIKKRLSGASGYSNLRDCKVSCSDPGPDAPSGPFPGINSEKRPHDEICNVGAYRVIMGRNNQSGYLKSENSQEVIEKRVSNTMC